MRLCMKNKKKKSRKRGVGKMIMMPFSKNFIKIHLNSYIKVQQKKKGRIKDRKVKKKEKIYLQ